MYVNQGREGAPLARKPREPQPIKRPVGNLYTRKGPLLPRSWRNERQTRAGEVVLEWETFPQFIKRQLDGLAFWRGRRPYKKPWWRRWPDPPPPKRLTHGVPGRNPRTSPHLARKRQGANYDPWPAGVYDPEGTYPPEPRPVPWNRPPVAKEFRCQPPRPDIIPPGEFRLDGRVAAARILAENHLACRFPHLWTRTQTVAATAERLTARAGFTQPDRSAVIAAAWLHQIGHVHAGHKHARQWAPIDGARWVLEAGFGSIVTGLVLFHTANNAEAELLGHIPAVEMYVCPPVHLLDVLTYANMTVGLHGQPVTYEQRRRELAAATPAEVFDVAVMAFDMVWSDLVAGRGRVFAGLTGLTGMPGELNLTDTDAAAAAYSPVNDGYGPGSGTQGFTIDNPAGMNVDAVRRSRAPLTRWRGPEPGDVTTPSEDRWARDPWASMLHRAAIVLPTFPDEYLPDELRRPDW